MANGHCYASTPARELGVNDRGWVSAGLVPYNTGKEVAGFVEALATLC